MARVNTNILVLAGRLTKDAELIESRGNYGTKFSIAHNISFKVGEDWQERTLFLNCMRWSKYPPKNMDELRRGTQVLVEGGLDVNNWTDRNGEKRSDIEYKFFKVSILDTPKVQTGSGYDSGQVAPSSRTPDDDSIPF